MRCLLLALRRRSQVSTCLSVIAGRADVKCSRIALWLRGYLKLMPTRQFGGAHLRHRRYLVLVMIEAGADIDTVRRWLGQKTLAMAIHYSETADASAKMQRLIEALDPLGTKGRTKASNSTEKVSNSDSDFSAK